ncbi:TBL2 [Branchiostoma lanceolatum]|uniref:TBL2 protein n=1 Tax=Branchiostoma lanceolatum TaxID=7740 RepID=A0A8J9YQB8_BRALA|nr:TBL2 [Branchiostoma lanceolatum]
MRGSGHLSDHLLVRSHIKLHVSPAGRRQRQPQVKRLDVSALHNSETAAELQDTLMSEVNLANMSDDTTEDIEKLWSDFRNATYTAAADVLGFKKRKHQDWFDENDVVIQELLDSMHEAHRKILARTILNRLTSAVAERVHPESQCGFRSGRGTADMIFAYRQLQEKSVQVNVELDHATLVKFSPDNRAFIVALYNGNTIRVFRIGRKDEGTGIQVSALEQDFPQKSIKDIIGLGISSNGKFMMTAFADTSIYVWNTKPGGEVLATIDTHQMENYHAAVSPCGRFIGCSGFTPDVKVWEVNFAKGGDFKEVSRAFELKGHSSGVYSFDFNMDSTRMVSVSKDGTWRLWDTNIEYQKGQEASLLTKGEIHSAANCMVAMAPNGSSFAIAQGYDISLYSAETGQEEEKFTDVHAEPVTAVAFDLGSKYLVSTGDKHVRVLHNTVGYQALLHDLQHKLKTTQSTAYKMSTISFYKFEYQKGQEASLLTKGEIHSAANCMVAMAPNGSSFAIAQGYDISLYSAETGQEEEKFTDVHAEPVTAVAFDLGSKYLVSTGDKHVRVLHNTVGYQALLHDLQHKLKTTQSTAYKERLKEQIKETEDALKAIVGDEKGEKDKKDKENSKKKGK